MSPPPGVIRGDFGVRGVDTDLQLDLPPGVIRGDFGVRGVDTDLQLALDLPPGVIWGDLGVRGVDTVLQLLSPASLSPLVAEAMASLRLKLGPKNLLPVKERSGVHVTEYMAFGATTPPNI
jgi:hypothetical protein